jgi:site-specific DNA recombinase
MMATTGLRLDGYVRVSKVGGRSGEGFISPDVQADAIRRWAGDRHVLTLHPPELDRSGGTMDRPIFNAVMERIRSGRSDGIVVYRVDRFARSLLSALATLEEIAQAGGSFASVSDNVDLTTAQGRAFLQMQLVFAQLFRDQVREGFAMATSRAVARGVHIANAVPPGYDRVNQRLVPNADAPAIRELFERRAGGDGASVLARWLDTALPRPNGELWTPAHVQRLLRMRVYTGVAHYGEHSNPEAHEPIVSSELFARADAARAPAPPRSGRTHLLAGIVRCAGCRYLMAPSKSGRNHDVLVYRCREKHTAGLCPAPATIRRDAVESYVLREAERALALGSLRGSQAGPELGDAIARLETLKAERDAFAADVEARGILGDAAWRDAYGPELAP